MTTSGVRLDKWLWAARFFKTRSLATTAVDAGHIHLNGQRPKPAREVQVGDRLEIVRGEVRQVVTVQALGDRRGPASIAQTLYMETAESLAAREKARASRPFAQEPAQSRSGRPTKRDRRQLSRISTD